MAEKTKVGAVLLPIARIKTIMKSSPDVSVISQESLFLVTKATEVFIQDLAKMCLEQSDGKDLDYNDLADIVNQNETMLFLQDIVPQKVTVRDYYAMMGKQLPNSICGSDVTQEESS